MGKEQSWQPISEKEIWDLINLSWEKMNIPQRILWDVIRIDPEKWMEHSYGVKGGGFWVVAILGKTIIWYNDIEEGFNRSTYRKYGTIEEYWCNQDELTFAVQNILNEIKEGNSSGGYTGPPLNI